VVAVTRVQASYAVIRYIPSILREEFVNVGVILVCPEIPYQGVKAMPSFSKSEGKLSAFDGADGRFVQHAITKLSYAAKEKRFNEFVSTAPDGLLTVKGLFELSRTYHNNIRLTEPRTVLTADPEVTLRELYGTFVGIEKRAEAHARVTRDKMLTEVTRAFNHFDLFSRYPTHVKEKVQPIPGTPKVDIFYQNGVAHFYQVIPFVDPVRAVTAASSYRALAADVRKVEEAPELAKAKFSVFGYYQAEQGQDKEIRDVTERLKADGIELLDYREDAPKVAHNIKRELDAYNGAMPA
jgi:hypothetical protein